MIKAITYGTFDLFHVGHMRLLKRVKSKCDYLIVAVSTDEFNYSKGKKSYFSYEERVEILSGISFVDEVIPESNWKQKVEDVKKHHVDKFLIGDDWKGKFDFLEEYCEVEYLERTEKISTTKIKEDIKNIDLDKIIEMEQMLHKLYEILKVMKND